MNENLDLAEILKNCPKGTKLYSIVHGDVTLDCINSDDNEYPIGVDINYNDYDEFTKDGRMFNEFNGECVLFPSKDNRDWSTFKVPNKLPKTWEEFCKLKPNTTNDYYIDYTCSLIILNGLFSNNRHTRDIGKDKCLLPNKEYAEAMLALCQLIQLRYYYNDGWEPDWRDVGQNKYCIYYHSNIIVCNIRYDEQCVLSFKTPELRDEFLNNFRELIEIAKPLL